jgi:hypothetical protein
VGCTIGSREVPWERKLVIRGDEDDYNDDDDGNNNNNKL